MAGEITALWTQIAQWLRVNAPVTFACLEPPANEQALAELSQKLGLRIPPDLAELLRCCDGSVRCGTVVGTVFPRNFALMGTLEMAEDAQVMLDLLDEDLGLSPDEDWRVGEMWHPEWISLGSDFCGYHYVFDTRPNPPYGEIFERDKVEGPVSPHWATLADLLADTLDLLHGGAASRASLNYRHPELGVPVVRDGQLHWGQG